MSKEKVIENIVKELQKANIDFLISVYSFIMGMLSVKGGAAV